MTLSPRIKRMVDRTRRSRNNKPVKEKIGNTMGKPLNLVIQDGLKLYWPYYLLLISDISFITKNQDGDGQVT